MRCAYWFIREFYSGISRLTRSDQIDAHEEMKRLLEQMDSPIKRLSDDLKSVRDGLESKVLAI